MLPLERTASKPLQPFVQGDFDSLCGLYSIVNAIRLAALPVRPLTSRQATGIFNSGIAYLHERRLLHGVITRGMQTRLWISLARRLCHYAESPSLVFDCVLPPHHGKPIQLVEARTWINDSLTRQAPVLILLERQDHFSVISGTSEKRLHLFDSWSYHYVGMNALKDSAGKASAMMSIAGRAKESLRRSAPDRGD